LKTSPRIGISVVSSNALDEKAINDIQKMANKEKLPAVLIFAQGYKYANNILKYIASRNDEGARMYVSNLRDFDKARRSVEMAQKKNEEIDFISDSLRDLGLTNLAHTKAAISTKVEEFSHNTPLAIRIAKFLELIQLGSYTTQSKIRNMVLISTTFPGNTRLNFLIATDKKNKDECMGAVSELFQKGQVTIIVSNLSFTSSEKNQLQAAASAIWSTAFIDEKILLLSQNKVNPTQILRDIIIQLKLIDDKTGQLRVDKGAELRISELVLDPSSKAIVSCKIKCMKTDYFVRKYRGLSLEDYRLDKLGIPDDVKFFLDEGMCPIGTDAKNIKRKMNAKMIDFPESSKWEVFKGTLRVKQATLSEDDDLLQDLQEFQLGEDE
jgi:hypothetical protein